MAEPIMVDCSCAGTKPHFVPRPILVGAPAGYVCAGCGEQVEIDEDGLSKPHKHPDILAMLDRGDYG